jgi:two-component system, chemotaxis family, sensor kinase CheA
VTAEEIQQIFFVECEESLASAEAGLDACRAGTHDADTVNAIFRAVHSIKGGAGAFGFAALQSYTHTFETLLSDVRDGTVALDDALISLLLRALDTLSDHVTAAREGGEAPSDAELIAELTQAQAGSGPAPVASAPAVEPAAAAIAPAADEGFDDDFGLDLDSMLKDLASDLAPPAPTNAAPDWRLFLRPHAGAMRNGGEPLLMLRDLAELGGSCVSCDMSAVPQLDRFDFQQGYLGWCFTMPASVSEAAALDIFDFVGDDCGISHGENAALPPLRIEAAAPPPTSALAPALAPQMAEPVATQASVAAPTAPPPVQPSATAAAGQSIRIDLTKLDRLIDSVGELVIAQAMLAQRLGVESIAAGEELALLETLTRDIQESAMSIRAQPISSVFSRVPRILRELASSTGKHVKLEVIGETTELDKTVIERLSEPLTHLIRNAVDHGIESAENRLAAGKSADGTLTLSAEQRSGRILIRIGDDGGGINRARVLAKAVEKGIVAPEAQLTNEEIDALIFAPGFSTAANVSSISGRGVGMDVVRQNVKELGGRITIESEEGKGTTFTLTLPLTLAISDGMIVNVGEETLVVPLAHVVESLRPAASDIHDMGTQRQMLNVRGRFIPVIAIHEAIGARNAQHSAEKGVLIVVDTESAGQAALLVDDICDQRQVVIKSLNSHYQQVDGVAGATILGDGRVALILDIDSLVVSSTAPPEKHAA